MDMTDEQLMVQAMSGKLNKQEMNKIMQKKKKGRGKGKRREGVQRTMPGSQSPTRASTAGRNSLADASPSRTGYKEGDAEVDSSCDGSKFSSKASSLVPYDPGNAVLEESEDEADAEPKTDAQVQTLTEAMKKSSVFSGIPHKRLTEVVACLKEVSCAAKQVIFEQGAPGDHVYIVETGEYTVHLKQAGEKPIQRLNSGDVFGELGVMYNTPRQATVKCRAAGTLWSLSQRAFQNITTATTKATTGLALAALRGSPMLGGLTDEQLELVASELEPLELEGGEVIGFEVKLAEAFYVIQKGSVVLTREVYVEGQEFDEEVGRLSAPSVFGEHALDFIPKSERRRSMANADSSGGEDNGDFHKPKMLRLANGAIVEAPGSSGKAKDKGSAHSRKSEAPPVWRDTIMTDPEVQQTVLLWMSREHFVEVLGHLKQVLYKNETRKLIEGCSIFQDLRPNHYQKLVDAINHKMAVSKSQGQIIYQQGDGGGQSMYLVRRGTVGLTTIVAQAPSDEDPSIDPSLRSLAYPASAQSPTTIETKTQHVRSGAVFGDLALLEDSPRAETAFAVESVELIVLSRKQIAKVLGSLDVIKEGQMERKLWEERRARAALFTLDELEEVTKLGSGTFGRVRLVKHKPTGTNFALKSMAKGKLIELRQLDNTINEKKIMSSINHPFLNQLVAVMCDDEPSGEVHLLLEVCLGGEIFTLLQQAICFDISMTTFCGACVASALVHLHSRRIVYRDLKPENLVFDAHGYVVIIDFGFAKVLDDSAKTYTLCGTPQYLSPEIVKSQGHGLPADWWAFGILLYEMLTGAPPFEDANAMGIYKQIMLNQITYPMGLRGKAKDIISKFLVSMPQKRLGGGKGGPSEVFDDPLFSAYDFNNLEKKQYQAPWVPQLSDERDTSHFDVDLTAADEDTDKYYKAAESPSYEHDILRVDAEFATLEGKERAAGLHPEEEMEMLRNKITAVKERAKQKRLAEEAARKAEEAERKAAQAMGDSSDEESGASRNGTPGANRPVSSAMLGQLAMALELAKAAEQVAAERAKSANAYAEQTAQVATTEGQKWAPPTSPPPRRPRARSRRPRQRPPRPRWLRTSRRCSRRRSRRL